MEDHSRLTLHPLVIRWEREACIVGLPATTTFVTVPPLGAVALELMSERLTLGEVRNRLEHEQAVAVDIRRFADDLIALGFVAAVDDRPLPGQPPTRPHLRWLRPHHVRWLLSKPMAAVYGIMVALAAITAVTTPRALPNPDSYFWLPGTSVAIVTNTALFVLIMALHELAHLVAARAFGVPARVGIGTRLNHLVAETDVTGIWALPRRARYQVYLAGMGCDLLLLSGAVLAAGHAPLAPPMVSVVHVVELSLLFGLASELDVYTRTDLYFVLMDVLECRDLHADARRYLRDRLASLWRHLGGRRGRAPVGETAVVSAMSDAEARTIARYAWYMLAGSVVALAGSAAIGIPILLELWQRAASSVLVGMTRGDGARLLDGTTAIVQQVALASLFVFAFIRSRMRAPTHPPH